MENIYQSLLGTAVGGIQSIRVVNDVVFINFKDGGLHDNVLIEKITFNYATELIESPKNGIFIDFGDTESVEPYTTTGNSFSDLVYDPKNKFIYLVGIHLSGNVTYPMIYSYDMNAHITKNIFPNISLDGWLNGSPSPSGRAVMAFNGGSLTVAFQSETSDAYLNIMDFTLNKESCILTDYKLLTGFNYSTFLVDGINGDGITYNYSGFNNSLKNK